MSTCGLVVLGGYLQAPGGHDQRLGVVELSAPTAQYRVDPVSGIERALVEGFVQRVLAPFQHLLEPARPSSLLLSCSNHAQPHTQTSTTYTNSASTHSGGYTRVSPPSVATNIPSSLLAACSLGQCSSIALVTMASKSKCWNLLSCTVLASKTNI